MLTYQLINGQTLNFEPAMDAAAFIDKVQAMAADITRTEDDLVVLIYGAENPILDHSRPGMAMVTPAVFANPVYHVLTDILFRKHCRQHGVTAEQLAEPYTITVAEAGERLGISRQAVLNAIDSHRLPAWMKDGQYFIDPAALASFKLSPRGPKPAAGADRASTVPLYVKCGADGRRVMHVKHATQEPTRSRSGSPGVELSISPWRRVGVFTADGERMRYFELVPGDVDQTVEFKPFYVRGRFSIAQTINNPRKAREAWEAFKPL